MEKETQMENFKRQLKKVWEENPLQTVAVGALALTAITKMLGTYSQMRRDRIWDREVTRRERQNRR